MNLRNISISAYRISLGQNSTPVRRRIGTGEEEIGDEK
jgi:hypothetical protein